MTHTPIPLTIIFLAMPSMAVAAGTTDAATLPWGEWVSSGLSTLSAVLVPIAAGAVMAGVARVAPWASSILTRQRIEAAIRAGAEYGLNAVAGAVRGRSVSVDLGASVVAAGTRHVLATAPSRVVKRAGGAEGVAMGIFRALPLDAQASAETVLEPALKLLGTKPLRRP